MSWSCRDRRGARVGCVKSLWLLRIQCIRKWGWATADVGQAPRFLSLCLRLCSEVITGLEML